MLSTTIAPTTAMKVEVPPVLTFLMLPRELIFSCLARVPKLFYPTLTLVSKSFRSLINSPELYKTRSLLARTESCLYVCIRFQNERNTHWFTLYRKPYQTKDSGFQTNKSGDYMLVSIQSPDFPSSNMSGVAAVGSDIYAIGGSIDGVSSSSVFVMDSHSHTWCKAPSMHVARVCPSASVLDGKIYVTSGGRLDYTNWMEVFDTKTRTWEFMPSPGKEIGESFDYENVALEGSIYVMSNERKKREDTFKLHKGRWRAADLMLTMGWRHYWKWLCYCVIENVLYCYNIESEDLCWYDFIDRLWRQVKRLKGLLPTSSKSDHCRLADYGGKLVILWEEHGHSKNVQNTTIWCAEISLERRQRTEICGTVEWCDVVFTYTKQGDLMHVIATTA